MNSSMACIMVNFNKLNESLRCIAHLRTDPAGGTIFFVDNGSSDQNIMQEKLIKYRDVILLPLAENRGFAAGVNHGLRQALADGNFKNIFIINNDAWIQDHSISCLSGFFDANLDYSIVVPKILYPDAKTIWSAGGLFHYLRMTGGNRGMGEIDSGKYDTTEPIQFASACAMLIRRQVFDAIGLFDERYVNYYEDFDFCMRARAKGFQIAYCPQATVLHEGSSTAGDTMGVFVSYYRYRNRLINIKKHGRMVHVLFNIVFLPLLAVRDSILYLCRGRFRGYRNLWRGVYDFMVMKFSYE
ncbi:MAG: glycosyltransferase [Elusimicrobia bacterium]|nr:glycosyltransferase [Elusimicrobiota bacterium]MBD3411557.1 glycosyltransferase [Elusimicrobiota bacterium]